MLKREEGRATETLGAAPSAFLRLSDDGAAELEQQTSLRRRMVAILLAGLVLVAMPLWWVTSAQGSGGDNPVAVKSNSGPGGGGNSGPGSGDDDEDNSGPGSGDDDDATTTGTTATTGVSNTATNDTAATTTGDGSAVTATGTTTGTGPSNTNTNDTATGTKTKA